ncbi:MAG: oligosaccharide flippase family protein, partial [Sphingobium sp.]
GGRIDSLIRNLGWLLASNGLMALLSLVYLGIATRTLGMADFGRFALVTGASQTIATLVGFETWQIIVRYGLDHEASGRTGALGRLLRTTIFLDLLSMTVGGLLLATLFTLWPDAFGIKDGLRPYLIGYAAIQLVTLRSTPIGILRLRDQFRLEALADSTTSIGRMAGALLALAFWPTLKGFLVAWATVEVFTAIAYWLMVTRVVDLRALLRSTGTFRTIHAENPGLLRFILSTNVQTSLGLAGRQVPLLLVGSFAGLKAAGAFRLALQLANALSKISILLTRAAFPEIVRSIRSVTRERFGWLIGRIAMSSIAGAAAVMLLIALLGKYLLMALGGLEYVDAYVLLLWLGGAGCVEIAAVSFEPILLAVQRAGTAMIAKAAAIAIQIVLMLLLLPRYGALGACIALVIGSLFAALFLGGVLWRYARRHDGIAPA